MADDKMIMASVSLVDFIKSKTSLFSLAEATLG
jgi:hypothetical protein